MAEGRRSRAVRFWPAKIMDSSDTTRIVPFDEADLDEVMKIENVSFATPWTRQCYLDLAPLGTIHFFVVKSRENVVGYMLYQGWGDELELHTIAVSPKARRQGIAKKMLEYMIGDARERGVERIFLQVRPSNTPARTLYEKFGFGVVGTRRAYYRDNNEDAYVMRLTLS